MTNFLKLFALLAVLVVTTGPVHASSVNAVKADHLAAATATTEAGQEDGAATDEDSANHEGDSEASDSAE
ncbi:MAG: hypothetical protein AB7S81_08085 [Bdellovibrionales bacterium]